jgi:WD40 repeat protein
MENKRNRQVLSLKGHEAQLTCCSVSYDGFTCATGSLDGNVILWNLIDGGVLRKIETHCPVAACKLSPMAKFIAYKLEDGRQVLYETLTNIVWRTEQPR